MKRRTFYKRLMAGAASLVVAPSVVANIKDDAEQKLSYSDWQACQEYIEQNEYWKILDRIGPKVYHSSSWDEKRLKFWIIWAGPRGYVSSTGEDGIYYEKDNTLHFLFETDKCIWRENYIADLSLSVEENIDKCTEKFFFFIMESVKHKNTESTWRKGMAPGKGNVKYSN